MWAAVRLLGVPDALDAGDDALSARWILDHLQCTEMLSAKENHASKHFANLEGVLSRSICDVDLLSEMKCENQSTDVFFLWRVGRKEIKSPKLLRVTTAREEIEIPLISVLFLPVSPAEKQRTYRSCVGGWHCPRGLTCLHSIRCPSLFPYWLDSASQNSPAKEKQTIFRFWFRTKLSCASHFM